MFEPKHFLFKNDKGVGTITLNRPEKLNSLTFDSYKELKRGFDALNDERDVRAIVITGSGKGFCSGGDQHDIIAELFSRDMEGLLEFTRITGALIKSIKECRKPVVAAVNGVAVGAGAVILAACDLRIFASKARVGYIFPKVGLCGADMGAAYLLPRLVGLGNASELLMCGELIDAEHALRIGLANRLCDSAESALAMANDWAAKIASGPGFAHTMTKEMIEKEHGMELPAAIEAEAQAQAICMQHPDFKEAHEAFKEKRDPRFKGATSC